jgi:hypothetical protein
MTWRSQRCGEYQLSVVSDGGRGGGGGERLPCNMRKSLQIEKILIENNAESRDPP